MTTSRRYLLVLRHQDPKTLLTVKLPNARVESVDASAVSGLQHVTILCQKGTLVALYKWYMGQGSAPDLLHFAELPLTVVMGAGPQEVANV